MMKQYIAGSLAFLLSGIFLIAQHLADPLTQHLADPLESLAVEYHSTPDAFSFDWWAASNYYYFIVKTEDFVDEPWDYFPYAVLGHDAFEGVSVSTDASKIFFRFIITNDLNSPLLQLDLDGDHVGAGDELRQGTDPFLSESLDDDAIPDDWETFHGLDTTSGVDSSTDDNEQDGLSDGSEFAANSDPNDRDHPDLQLEIF